MPRSKRDKTVSLTKTKKKAGRERKEGLVSQVQTSIDQYNAVFVFVVDNLRSAKLVQLRQAFKHDSLFCLGKRSLVCKALGSTKQHEYANNIHKLTKLITGQSGLLFTNREPKEIIRFFAKHGERDYARSGNEATCTVQLPEGALDQFPFSLEPHLRQLGMPTSLEKGVVTLTKPFTVCTKGDKLTPEQARILKLLEIQMCTFRISLTGYWNKSTGAVKRLSQVLKHKVVEEGAGQEGSDAVPQLVKTPSRTRTIAETPSSTRVLRARKSTNVITPMEV